MPAAESLRMPEEQPIDRRRVHWDVCLAGAINLEAIRVGSVQGERLTTAETEAVITDAKESIRMLLNAGAPVTHRDLQSVAKVFVLQAEADKRNRHPSD
ncbi:MAG: hypothetical protein PHO92_03515 [Candidatus Peribacteraceae bacterium]|nr:hypothetical protein [Candidatus Peribacteraceae bacterium]